LPTGTTLGDARYLGVSWKDLKREYFYSFLVLG
jgi:hypothetical protein